MRGTVIHAPGDVRVEDLATPTILKPTDAVIRLTASCVCGSDLWDYRGINPVEQPTPMGHEYVGIVEEIGSEVTTITPGQFVVGSFFASDNTCPICQAGYHTSCVHREFVGGAPGRILRVPLADGTLVATPGIPSDRPDPQPAGRLGCTGHRVVRRSRRRRPARARLSRSSVTARSGCSASSPPRSWVPTGSSR